MDLKQLEYFVTCAKCSSLTRAADALYTTQPHVSMVIRSLENELGVQLFRRKSKGVELTEDGQQVYIYAEKALMDTALISQIGRDQGKKWFRIATNHSNYMASLCTSFYDVIQDKGFLLQFTECGNEEMMEHMKTDRFDLGFLYVPMDRLFALKMMADRRKLEYVELFRSGLCLTVGEQHPYYQKERVQPKELLDLRFIQQDKDFFTVEELLGSLWKEESGYHSLNRVISTNSDHMMLSMLFSGKVCNLGTSWLQERQRTNQLNMIPVEGYEKAVSFGYLKRKNTPLNEVAEEFIEYLKQEIQSMNEK